MGTGGPTFAPRWGQVPPIAPVRSDFGAPRSWRDGTVAPGIGFAIPTTDGVPAVGLPAVATGVNVMNLSDMR